MKNNNIMRAIDILGSIYKRIAYLNNRKTIDFEGMSFCIIDEQ